MMRSILLITFLSAFSSFSQADSLVLADSIPPQQLEVIEINDFSSFIEKHDTAYSDQWTTIYENNESWAGQMIIHFSDAPENEYAILIEPEANTAIDTVQYHDVTGNHKVEAVIYYSRTDGRSGHSGGFSDQGKGVMIMDAIRYSNLMQFEYEASYEFWEQEYDKENDEYISLSSECHGFNGVLLICEDGIYFEELERACQSTLQEGMQMKQFYYTYDRGYMIRTILKQHPFSLCP